MAVEETLLKRGIFSIKIDIRPNHKGDMYVQVGATKNGKGIASSVISVHVKKP